ncbi:MAG TPA: methylated-DNA--[protein]-cysteine S-methyltransferase [Aliidongia sp.]|uniref:methylated-DNA--[protein]-cysteine S-methyltransferase n=1 Tax=Aliidongia sp. TaxID=1914230 RepID=UPI002DDD69EA|nr:methylated-DNA--[protein]-cysteine S-methyltransferase [Aliidongia sp.]HEV2675951.1 methylated-DNA--[protein]-cysteine S-methyltransferase [Aliidongia sp.]
MTDLDFDRVPSAIGDILVASDGAALVALDYAGYEARMKALLTKRYGPFRLVERADPLGASARVRAYLAGDFTAFDDLPVATGGTEFQEQCWRALRAIPVGTITTYGALAARLGRPKASRAVGYANSLNPVAIILACHRVVGHDRDLTGYAGGLERKRWLLAHEGVRM